MPQYKKNKIQIKCNHINIESFHLECPDCQLKSVYAITELFDKTLSTNAKLKAHYPEFIKN